MADRRPWVVERREAASFVVGAWYVGLHSTRSHTSLMHHSASRESVSMERRSASRQRGHHRSTALPVLSAREDCRSMIAYPGRPSRRSQSLVGPNSGVVRQELSFPPVVDTARLTSSGPDSARYRAAGGPGLIRRGARENVAVGAAVTCTPRAAGHCLHVAKAATSLGPAPTRQAGRGRSAG